MYREVINNVIGKERVPHGRPWRNVSFCPTSTLEDYKKVNLYPENTIRPEFEPNTQKLVGPEEIWNKVHERVDIVYTVAVLEEDELAAVAKRRKDEVAALRYQKEIAGITVDGQTIRTDVNSQLKLAITTIASILDPTLAVNWKGKDGSWKAKSATDIQTTFAAVVQAGQALYNKEKELATALETDINADITTGWPE